MFTAIHPATYRGGGILAHGVLNLHITKQPPETAFVFDYPNTKALFFFYAK